VTLQRRRGKSPFAIESIDDRYCRSPRGVLPQRGKTRAVWREADVSILSETSKPRSIAQSAMNTVAACTAGAAKCAQ